MKEFSASQASDAVCSQVMKYCQFGWPEKHRVTDDIKPYWALRVIPVIKNRDLKTKTSIHNQIKVHDIGSWNSFALLECLSHAQDKLKALRVWCTLACEGLRSIAGKKGGVLSRNGWGSYIADRKESWGVVNFPGV